MKKKLSLLLALVMILTLVPMSAFAATDNSVNKVPQVTDDYKFTSNAPQLRIEEKNNNEFGTAKQTFRLKLDNAEWLTDKDISGTANDGSFAVAMKNGQADIFSIERLTDTTVEAVVYNVNTSRGAEIVVNIPMLAEVTAKGDVKVTVDPLDSAVTGGTYTFATAAGGDTVVSIEDTVTFTDIGDLKTIEIQETKVGSLSGDGAGKKIKLKLPSDFKWNTTVPTITLSGGLSTATAGTPYIETGSDRTLIIPIDYATSTSATRGSIFVKGAKIEADSDADYGDVELSVSGDSITSEDLVIATYDDYTVVAEADGDPKELVAGRKPAYNDDDNKLQTLIIKETVDGSWISNRKTRVEFPNWVKIVGATITDDKENLGTVSFNSGAFTDKGDNYIEFTADQAAGKGKIGLKFYVSIEAGNSGDIVATVSGRSIGDEFEVVLGEAINPVSVKADVADVRTGIKNQEIGNITITENVDEAITKGDIEVVLDENVEWTEVPTIEVTDGNIDLDVEGAKVDGNVLTIPVDSDSSKPATIEISDIKLDLDRTVAEGDIDVKIGGDAIVKNKYVDTNSTTTALDNGYFKEDYAAETVAARVITPADTNTKAGVAVQFVIGEASYKAGDVTKTADVAPYISNGRTMLSVRFVAEALGVSNSDIVWNDATKTVTIFKGDRVAQVTIGSNVLYVNGTPVTMDTVAEIKDGRTMLPVSFVAKALGADVTWDGATKTVTIE